jgi:uncharacterized membrane protein YGL010W
MQIEMAKQNQEEVRKIDVLFAEYEEYHQNPTNNFIHYIFVPLITFSIIGLVTAIPFPQISFLGKYNMFINWFSFLLAFSIYFYLRLSPLLSYFMLFAVAIMYFFIVQLEYVEQGGGPALWQVSLVIFVLSAIGQFIGHKKEVKKSSLSNEISSLFVGPLWLMHLLLKKLNLRY